MFPDLPEHLQTLNTLSPSPPSGSMINTEYEDAVWKYLNTDDLFHNFGTQPAKDEQPSSKLQPPADLKSFIEQFANEPPIPLPLPFNAEASSSSEQAGVFTADVMPALSAWGDSPSEDGRVSGAKKLKQIGAGVAEIEEDKRRRNTEASARFRAKKKEREQALEQTAKELAGENTQLRAEMASLANENKLLKAIVLGSGTTQGQDALQAVIAALGKRKRE